MRRHLSRPWLPRNPSCSSTACIVMRMLFSSSTIRTRPAISCLNEGYRDEIGCCPQEEAVAIDPPVGRALIQRQGDEVIVETSGAHLRLGVLASQP